MSTPPQMPEIERASRLWAQGIAGCVQSMRRRELSSEELVAASLAAIDALNPLLNAFVHVAREHSTKEARECDLEASKGKFRGPLHGIPIAVKDIIDVEG